MNRPFPFTTSIEDIDDGWEQLSAAAVAAGTPVKMLPSLRAYYYAGALATLTHLACEAFGRAKLRMGEPVKDERQLLEFAKGIDHAMREVYESAERFVKESEERSNEG